MLELDFAELLLDLAELDETELEDFVELLLFALLELDETELEDLTLLEWSSTRQSWKT